MLEKVAEHLAASGPVALVLGVFCYLVWNKLVAVLDDHAAQEDAMRTEHAAERLVEAERHAAEESKARGEVLALYDRLVRAVRKEPSQHD